MILRKFEITSITMIPGGRGPERVWKIAYKAIKNKLWVEGTMHFIGRTEQEARHKAEQRFGGRD